MSTDWDTLRGALAIADAAEPRSFDGAGAVATGGHAHAVHVAFDVTTDAESRPFGGTLEPCSGPRPIWAGGPLELADGATYVSAETSRRLACDAAVVAMHHDASGTVLDVGRKTRTIHSAIRRALLARDTRCRFPGCSARRCDAHHVVHWFDGGATHLENLVLLCRRHHRAVHEGGFTLGPHPDGSWIVHRPNGTPLEVAPVLPPWDRESNVHTRDGSPSAPAHPLDPLTAALAAAGIVLSARSTAVWDGTPFDVVWAMDVLRPRPGRSGRSDWTDPR